MPAKKTTKPKKKTTAKSQPAKKTTAKSAAQRKKKANICEFC